MDRPAPDEIARALKALGLGALLGMALRLFGRGRSRGEERPNALRHRG